MCSLPPLSRFVIAAGLLASAELPAQLTLERTELDHWFMPVEFENNGLKYLVYDIFPNAAVGITDSIRLLNADFTPWRTIAVPPSDVVCDGDTAGGVNIFYLSDALFDTDPSDVEFLVLFLCGAGGNYPSVGVYGEDGEVLLEEPNAATWEFFSSSKFYSVHNTSEGTKLNLITLDPANPNSNYTGCKIWSLPGNWVTQLPEAPDLVDGMMVYPNPSTGEFNVHAPNGFTLEVLDAQGRQVMAPTATAQANAAVSLALSEGAGTYYIRVRDEGGKPVGVRPLVLTDR